MNGLYRFSLRGARNKIALRPILHTAATCAVTALVPTGDQGWLILPAVISVHNGQWFMRHSSGISLGLARRTRVRLPKAYLHAARLRGNVVSVPCPFPGFFKISLEIDEVVVFTGRPARRVPVSRSKRQCCRTAIVR